MALVAPQITVGLLGVEVGGGSAKAGATRHAIILDGAEGRQD